MYDIVTADRAAPENQRGTPVPVWTPRGARPQSDEGSALWAPARPKTADEDRSLYRRLRHRPRWGNGDAGQQLIQAILNYFGRNLFSLTQSRHTPWASITFSGARHELTVEGCMDAQLLTAKLQSISEDIFELRGHILADVTARVDPNSPNTRLVVEALTVESA